MSDTENKVEPIQESEEQRIKILVRLEKIVRQNEKRLKQLKGKINDPLYQSLEDQHIMMKEDYQKRKNQRIIVDVETISDGKSITIPLKPGDVKTISNGEVTTIPVTIERTKPAKMKRTKFRNEPELTQYEDLKPEIAELAGIKKKTLYGLAEYSENTRIFGWHDMSPDQQLDCLKAEIIVSVKITKQEIFKIGKLLHIAKKVCQQEKIGFENWITGNFNFSYQTAFNFMSVYDACFGFEELAIKVPVSILYKLSAKNFDPDLRYYLLTQGNLEKISNGRFTQLIKKYNEEGREAVKPLIENIDRYTMIHRQTQQVYSIFDTAVTQLEKNKDRIEDYYKTVRGSAYVETEVQGSEPEAVEIVVKLWETLAKTLIDLNKLREETKKQLEAFSETVLQKLD